MILMETFFFWFTESSIGILHVHVSKAWTNLRSDPLDLNFLLLMVSKQVIESRSTRFWMQEAKEFQPLPVRTNWPPDATNSVIFCNLKEIIFGIRPKLWIWGCLNLVISSKGEFTCFLHRVHRPFTSWSLLHTFENLILCVANFPTSAAESEEENSLDLVNILTLVIRLLASASFLPVHDNFLLGWTYKEDYIIPWIYNSYIIV